MNLNDQTLAALVLYGLPVLFSVIFVAAAGAPLPSTLLLIVAGTLVGGGEMSLWPVVALATTAAVMGDNLGYALGRRGGRPLALRLSQRLKQESRLAGAEQLMVQWGGIGVFFSRWLLTPLGPWLNVAGGITLFSWKRFIVWGTAGEALWVSLYVGLGILAGEQLGLVMDGLGDLIWLVMALFATVVIGRQLVAGPKNSQRSSTPS
jgi:membrane-associated protein